VNDLIGQGNAMRVVQTLEALRKVADPFSGAAAAGSGGGGGGDHIGDSKPPKSTMEKKAESFIPPTAAATKTTTLDPFNVKDTFGVMNLVLSFLFDCLID